MMNCVIFGPPGSGKGTQATALCERFGMAHLSTGDMLREAVRKGAELGLKAQAIMTEGKLVPDDLVGGIVREKVADLKEQNQGVLFDGYPRNIDQAVFLDTCLEQLGTAIDIAAVLEIPADTLVERICGRRLCTKTDCEGSFNIHFMPPREEGKCDICGSELMQRKDDNEETLRERLAVYDGQTLPILDHYDAKNILIRVDANDKVDRVREALATGIAGRS